MDKSLTCRASIHGADGLLCLNGLVLCKLAQHQQVHLSIHEFIQSGENRLQVLTLPSDPKIVTSGLNSRSLSVHVQLELQKDRGPSCLVKPQVLFEFHESIPHGKRLKNDLLLDVLVNLPVSFPHWRFLDLRHASADEKDLPLLQEFLMDVLQHVQEKNTAALLPLFSLRNRELVEAYMLDGQQVHSDFKSHLNEACTQAQLCEFALEPQTWRFHKLGHTPIYAVLNSDFQPLLQFFFPNRTIQIPLHVGVLGGEVFVLR